jgi:hypothetical protein
MGLAVKVIERRTLFASDPFNFIMVLATESNKIAHAHRLTSSQQRDLILTYIPTNSPEYSLLELCDTLQEMFAVISTYSDQIYTRAELEKKVNQWTLDNSSHRALRQSVVALLELLQKTTDHDFQNDKPELFRLCITRIQMEKLPVPIHTALNEARMKIRSTDTMVDLTQTLLAALNRYVGMRPTKMAAAKAIEQHEASPQEPENQEDHSRNPRGGRKGTPRNNGRGKPSFVPRWPEGEAHLSRDGTQLLEAFTTHFQGHCVRCGHSSHKGLECRIYPERTLTLCTHCHQGLHEFCKSKRRDLGQQTNSPPDELAAIKQCLLAHDMLLRGLFPQGPQVTYPMSPAPALPNKSAGVHDAETSDEDD